MAVHESRLLFDRIFDSFQILDGGHINSLESISENILASSFFKKFPEFKDVL